MTRKANTPKATRCDGDDYEIGYRRPPRASQWSRGQSGNPSGRPKKRKTLDDFIQEILDEEIVVETKDGRRRRMKKGRMLAEKIIVMSGRGNASATRVVAGSDARRVVTKTVDGAGQFDSEAPLTADELEIAAVGLSYLLRGLEDLDATLDAHSAKGGTGEEGKP